MEDKLCCVVNPHGKCENCGLLFCRPCSEARRNWTQRCPNKGMREWRDGHYVTEAELDLWKKQLAVKRILETE